MRTAGAWMGIVLLLAACQGGEQHLPEAAGGQGEILVVMDKGHWEGQPGAVVRSILEEPVEGLPQREARFKVAQTTPGNFGSLLSVHHSVLLAVIGNKADTVAALIARDLHARGQLVAQVSAHDPATWVRMMQREGPAVANAFEDHQRARVARRLAGDRDAAIASSVRSRHGIDLVIPGGFRIVEQDQDFTRLQRDRLMTSGGLEHNLIEGLLVYSYPYTSDSTFTVPYLVDVRDAVTRQYVEGPNPGSYMIVQRAFEDLDLMPVARMVEVDGRTGMLMHGLFGMNGAKMGGPFVSLTCIDGSRNRVVTIDGFVYAPQFDKREYIRELEALLFSLHIDPDPTPLMPKM